MRVLDRCGGQPVAVKIVRQHQWHGGCTPEDRLTLLTFCNEVRFQCDPMLSEITVVPQEIGLVAGHCLASEGALYLVTERAEGEDLFELQHEATAWPLDYKRQVARQMISAVAMLHQSGVIHRDIALDNFVLSGSAQEPAQLKLIDFGWAQRDTERQLGIDIIAPQPDQRLVLRHYSTAPEGACDASSDVYALGVALRNLFVPAQMHYVPSAWLDPVMWRALETRRTRRFPDASAMLDAFEHCAGQSA